MTSTLSRPADVGTDTDPGADPDHRRGVRLLVVGVLAGVALGVVDLLLQLSLPYPWANLANSSAVWALVAFGFGAWAKPAGALRGAVGGVVLLVTAVVAYYAAAAVLHGDDWANVWAPSSVLWAVFGVLAGVVFGGLGTWTRSAGWRGVVAAAVAGSVCFAEYALLLTRADADVTGAVDADLVQTGVITAVLGLVVLGLAARTPAVIGRAMLLAVPLTAVGAAGFVLGGFAA